MSSGSKEAAAGDFIVAVFIFDFNYTMCSLFLRATEITHLLNLRVSSKGKGSARFVSSSVSSTQSQKSQRDDSDMIKHYLIPLHPILSETRRLKATDQRRFMSLHKSEKPARGQFSPSRGWQEHHYFLRSVQIKVTKDKQGLQVRPNFTPLQLCSTHLDKGKHHSTVQFLKKPLKHTHKAGLLWCCPSVIPVP